MAQCPSRDLSLVGGCVAIGGRCGAGFAGWLVGRRGGGYFCCLRCIGGGFSRGVDGSGFAAPARSDPARRGDDGICDLGVGESCLDGCHVVIGAKGGFPAQLASPGGWLCGDDEGVLGGRVVALATPKSQRFELIFWRSEERRVGKE